MAGGEKSSMKTKRKLAKQSIFYSGANGIEALVPFLLAPILTRTLTPDAYGVWVLFITYTTFLRPLVGLTIQDAIRMRFYDFNQKQLDQFTHTAFFIMTHVMFLGLLIVLLFQDSIAAITKFPRHWLVSIVVTAFIYELFYTVLALQQFHGRRMFFLYTQIIQAVLSMLFVVTFLTLGWGWEGVVVGRALGLSAAVIAALYFLDYRITFFFRLPKRAFYRNIASFGVLYFPSGMIVMAMGLTDKMVAAHYLGVAASAIYGVAALFASAFWVINTSFLLAWTPWLFRRLRSNTVDDRSEIFMVSALYFAVVTLAAVTIYYFSLWIAPYLIGEAFHEAIEFLPFIMLAVLLQGFFMHNMKFLHNGKKIALMSLCSIVSLALNLWLSIEWSYTMGIKGIMLATSVSFGVAFLLSGVMVIYFIVESGKGIRAVV
jgi:O-antigen/teichoic acid export membrane protein